MVLTDEMCQRVYYLIWFQTWFTTWRH